MPRYSIVMLSYNIKKLTINSLEAFNRVRRKGDDDFEIIIADDGSSDGTLEKIRRIPKNYKLNYVHLSRCSESSRNRSRNMGWKLARGEIVIFTDGDIIVKENFIEELDRCYQYSKDLIICGFRYFLFKKTSYSSIKDSSFFSKHSFALGKANLEFVDDRNIIFDKLSYNSNAFFHPWLVFYTCMLGIPRHVLEADGGFDENIKLWGFDEAEMNYRFYKNGRPFVINSRLETFHQNHPTRGIHEQFKEMAVNIEYYFKKHPEQLEVLPKNLIDYYYNASLTDILTPGYNVLETIELKCTQSDQYPVLQEKILSSKDKAGTRIIVKDYCENTDLDIWIQLLGKTNALIQYFPMSKKMDLINVKR